jgi:hypothetical protein
MSIAGNSSFRRAARVFACIGLFVLPAIASDITPPTLNSFTFTPTSINTTTNSATVTVTAQLSDNLSGVQNCAVYFIDPSGTLSEGAYLYLISGTNLNGTYQGQVVIPAYAEPGTWTAQIYASDNDSNFFVDNAAQLQSLGFPTNLQVTSQQDITPPTLISFTFTPTSVNTTTSSANVTVTAQLSDDLSGVQNSEVDFTNPSGTLSEGAYLYLISGTNLNGTYQGQVVIPAYAEPGTWTAQIYASDNDSNFFVDNAAQLQALGFPTNLQVNSGSSVALTSSLNPSTYGQPVTFTATVTSGSGIVPTGSVNFNDGSTTLGSATLDSSGVGTFTTSTLTVGTHSIVAAYLGDPNNPAASSTALNQVVAKAATTTTLHSSPNPSTAGSEVTFNAAVASAGETVPGGMVAFNDGPTLLCRRNLVNGHAACRTENLAIGKHHVTARYLGDMNSQSSKASIQQVVQ